MMGEKQATRTCGHCRREIAVANFSQHESHCGRFLCLCPDCDAAVPRERLRRHGEEQHSQVKCSKCNRTMDRRHLKDHESDQCEDRLPSCPFCQLELPRKELDEHLTVCGSRTDLCGDFGRRAPLRERLPRGLTCSAADRASAPAQATSKPAPNDDNNSTRVRASCDRREASFPAEDIDEHELWRVPAATGDEEDEQEEKEREDESDISRKWGIPGLSSTFKATSLSDRASRVPPGDGHDADEISTCPYCQLALPLLTLLWHKKKCQIHILMK